MLLLNSTKKVQQVWVSLFGGPHIMFSNECMKWRSIEEHSHVKFYLLKSFKILRIKEMKVISLYQPVSIKEVELSLIKSSS